uniref:Uncharacterized protein n=1 Tax=Oryza barthii TaxID=65489 RepID=A0A0D3H7I9_9ORYZ
MPLPFVPASPTSFSASTSLRPQGCRDGVLRAERMRLGSTVKARGYAVVLLEKAEATGRWASAVVEATSGHGVNDGVFYHVRWI